MFILTHMSKNCNKTKKKHLYRKRLTKYAYQVYALEKGTVNVK